MTWLLWLQLMWQLSLKLIPKRIDMFGEMPALLKKNQLKEHDRKKLKETFAHPSLEVDTCVVVMTAAGCRSWLIYEWTVVNELVSSLKKWDCHTAGGMWRWAGCFKNDPAELVWGYNHISNTKEQRGLKIWWLRWVIGTSLIDSASCHGWLFLQVHECVKHSSQSTYRCN